MKSNNVNPYLSEGYKAATGRKEVIKAFIDVLKMKKQEIFESYKGLIYISLGANRLPDQIQN